MAGYPPRSWGRPRVEVFAVEPHAVQLTWRGLAPGSVRITVGGRTTTLPTDGTPGGITLDALTPTTRHRIDVESIPGLRRIDVESVPELKTPGNPGLTGPRRIDVESAPRFRRIDVESTPRSWRFDVTTPEVPPGEQLFRLATVSDVHIGLDFFGLSRRMRERKEPAVPHAERCLTAALAEAKQWGAEFLVVKGDLVEGGRPEEWAAADRILAESGLPVALVPGNHEVKPYREIDPPPSLPLCGGEIIRGVAHHDFPGLRLILVDSSVDGEGHGAVDHHTDEVATLAAEAATPVIVAMHQHPQRFEWAWFWPPGIPGNEGRRFLDAVATANPRTLVTSGHTHRNRARRHGPITVTEVGSTKDFPGVWGGYTVHEGGITQTVRRTLSPEAIGWTEYTRRAVLGIWGRWAIGTLTDRCVVMNR